MESTLFPQSTKLEFVNRASNVRSSGRSMARIFIRLAVGTGLLCVSSLCHARSASELLVWADAPAGCVDTEAWRERVQAALPSRGQNGGPWRLVLRLTNEAGTLWIQAADGAWTHRTLEGSKCSDIAEALALVAVMALEQPEQLAWLTTPPPAPLRETEREEEQELPPPTSPSPVPPVPARPANPREDAPLAKTSLYAEAGTGLMTARGLGPDTGVFPYLVGAMGTSGAWAPRLRVTIAKAFVRRVQTEFGVARLDGWDMQAQPCVGISVGWGATVRGCGLLGVTTLVGNGEETIAPATESRTFGRAGWAGRVDVELFSALVLDAGVGGTVAFSRPRFYFAPSVTAYEVPRWAVTADVAAAVRFW